MASQEAPGSSDKYAFIKKKNIHYSHIYFFNPIVSHIEKQHP